MIGTVEKYPEAESARNAVSGLISEVNWANQRPNSVAMTIAQLCGHFEQRELARSNTWRSYSTKRGYAVYLRRWVVPQWGRYELRNIRTIEVESWLRRLPLAKSSCAKIRNVMSVLFNHACRYGFFDRNPIHLVRQGAHQRVGVRRKRGFPAALPITGGGVGAQGATGWARTQSGLSRASDITPLTQKVILTVSSA